MLALEPLEIPFRHLVSVFLPGHAARTLALITGAAFGAILIGTSAAWLTSAFRFPGSLILRWTLPLPLAIPPYLAAYIYAEMLDYAGPVQTSLRRLMGWQSPADYLFPDIRSLWGGIAILSLTLYPYVYVAAQTAFSRGAAGLMQAARTMGGSWRSFRAVALPLARPAIAAGAALVMMEALNDIGLAEHLGIRTLSVGIYHLWFERGDLAAAALLALLTLLFAAALLALERRARAGRRFDDSDAKNRLAPQRLTGKAAFWAWLVSALPLALGFLLPAAALITMSAAARWDSLPPLAELFAPSLRSLFLGALGAALLAVAATLLAYGGRLLPQKLTRAALLFGTMGYALPGAVIGLGIALPLSYAGALIADFGVSSWLVFSVAILLLAYAIRFLALPYRLLEAGFARIPPSLDQAASMVGKSPAAILSAIHLPQLAAVLAGGALFAAIEIMRELPITLFLRPLGFETLAIQIYARADAGHLEEAALPALVLILLGLFPTYLWARRL